MSDPLFDDLADGVAEGWSSLADAPNRHDPEAQHLTELAFARCFAGEEGKRVLTHLQSITLDRALGPTASDAAIRHLDGQRCLVLHIRSLIDRGRGRP